MFCVAHPAERFICSQPWYPSLPATLQEAVRSGVYQTEGAKGEVMLPVGSQVEGWHAVLQGLVTLRSPACKARTSAFIGIPDGEWFGEGSALKAEARKYEVVALRPTSLLCLPLPLFHTLRDTSLAFNQFLVQHMNLRLGQAMAIIEAGVTRLRPILMTSLTTILGLVVMAFGKDVGTALMQPVALVCIGGLLYATLMTLLVVPCMYDILSRRDLRKVNEEELQLLDL